MAYSFDIHVQANGITMPAGDLYRLHVTELKNLKSLDCNSSKGQCDRCSLSKDLCIKIDILVETIAAEPPFEKKDLPQVYIVRTDMDLIAFHIYTLYLLKNIVCTQICKENCFTCFLKVKDKCCKVLDIFHHRFDGCVINGDQIG